MTSEDLATILVRFDGGAKGAVSVGQVCAGHKNDLWLEVNGATASLRWRQEQQNELWIGRRDEANMTAGERSRADGARGRAIRALARRTSGGMGGCVRQRHARHLRLHHESRRARPPAMATFEDGYRVACLVDAVLESHAQGGVWTTGAGCREWLGDRA